MTKEGNRNHGQDCVSSNAEHTCHHVISIAHNLAYHNLIGLEEVTVFVIHYLISLHIVTHIIH